MRPTKWSLLTHIKYVPGVPLVYILNPKAGCSTLMGSLWNASDLLRGEKTLGSNPHDPSSPFVRGAPQMRAALPEMLEYPWVSVVRNPYSRILSAYLNKIPRAVRDPYVWSKFAPNYGLGDEAEPLFGEFLSMLSTESDLQNIDPHFRPQWANLHIDYLPLSFIGRLEKMSETQAWLSDHGVELFNMYPHRTNASDKIRMFFGAEEKRLVDMIYARDFELFGYSDDLDDQMPKGGIMSAMTKSDIETYLAP